MLLHRKKSSPLILTPRSILTDDQLALLGELVLGDLEVERGGSLSYTAGDVVVRTVAGAEPATEVTGLTNGDTTQMGADT
jgi:hypothetical protein